MLVRYDSIQTGRTIASNEAAPTTVANGVDSSDLHAEALWYLSGGTSCTVTPWWYDDNAEAWVAGTSSTITGDQAYRMYTHGGRLDIQLTGMTGTYEANYRLMGAM